MIILSQTAYEEIYIQQMLKELKIKLDQSNKMIIQCDNQQILYLMQAEIEKLSTKLKHVDIQNHWLHQEYQQRHINIHYIDMKSMIADSLMKALLLNSHHQFLEQMNLIDIQEHLLDCLQDCQTIITFELSELMNID